MIAGGWLVLLWESSKVFLKMFQIHLEWSSWIISVETWNSGFCDIPWCFWQFASGLSQFPFRENPTVSDQPAICPQPWWTHLHHCMAPLEANTNLQCGCVNMSHHRWPHHYQVHQSWCTSKQRSAHLGGNELHGQHGVSPELMVPGLSRVNPCGPSA